jgi:hypothetical protein
MPELIKKLFSDRLQRFETQFKASCQVPFQARFKKETPTRRPHRALNVQCCDWQHRPLNVQRCDWQHRALNVQCCDWQLHKSTNFVHRYLKNYFRPSRVA